MQLHMHSMIKLLDAEYHAITSPDRGQSGTAVIEDLLVSVYAICGRVHMLVRTMTVRTRQRSALRACQLNRVRVRTTWWTAIFMMGSCAHFEQAVKVAVLCRLYFDVYALNLPHRCIAARSLSLCTHSCPVAATLAIISMATAFDR
jgi:hypothetical protein